jgi:hypothetical protein
MHLSRFITLYHVTFTVNACCLPYVFKQMFLCVATEAVILVEQALINRQVFHDNIKDRKRQISMLTKAVSAQRNQWDSRVAAYEWFANPFPWKG